MSSSEAVHTLQESPLLEGMAGHDLSDERVRSLVVVVIRLKSQIFLKKGFQCVLYTDIS